MGSNPTLSAILDTKMSYERSANGNSLPVWPVQRLSRMDQANERATVFPSRPRQIPRLRLKVYAINASGGVMKQEGAFGGGIAL